MALKQIFYTFTQKSIKLKISKEVRVGLFTIIAVTLLYKGFNFLKGIDFFQSQKRYFVNYENVSGLQVGNMVMVNGLSVGRVSEIKILDNSAHTLQVAFDIQKSIVVGDSAVAIIASTGLLGDKALVMYLGNAEKPLPENSFIKGVVETSLTDKLSATAAPIAQSVQTTLNNVNAVMSQKNLESIAHIIDNLDKTSQIVQKVAAANQAQINATLKNVSTLTESLISTEKQLKLLLAKSNTFADSLNKMPLAAAIYKTSSAVHQLNVLLEEMNDGKGTLGKLAKDDSLYIHLNRATRDLDLLLVNMREKPSRYVHFSVFGKKDSKP